MGNIIRLTESEMNKLIKRIITEDETEPTPLPGSGYQDTVEGLKKFLEDKFKDKSKYIQVYPKKMGYYTLELANGKTQRVKFENNSFKIIKDETVENQVDEHTEIITRSLDRRGIDPKSTDQLRYKLKNWARDPQPCTEKEWNSLAMNSNAKGVIPTYSEIMAYYWFLS